MNPIHFCFFGNRTRRAAVRLMQAAALSLILVSAIPARATDEREIISRVPPAYPELAKRMRIFGGVKVVVTVDPEGKVVGAKAVSGSQMLWSAAETAVRQWKFGNGTGVANMEVDLKFGL